MISIIILSILKKLKNILFTLTFDIIINKSNIIILKTKADKSEKVLF
jgi:hypothetical protein